MMHYHRRQDRIDHRGRRSTGARRCSPSMTHRTRWCCRGRDSSAACPHTCPSGSAYRTTLLGTTASTSGDTYLFMWLTFRYFFFPIPLHSYTTLVLRIALWEEEVMISSGRLTRPCWRLSFKSLASRMMCWYLLLLLLLLLLLSGDENWLCPMHDHSWYQIARQGVTLRRRRRSSWGCVARR